jgi:hypothetical protein
MKPNEVATIVERVEGIELVLPTKDRSGAEHARISATQLAKGLGYPSSKDGIHKLRQLAERHAKYLNDIDQVTTVVTWQQAPGQVAPRQVEEQYFTREQALYLVGKSGTERANELHVRLVKAFAALLDRYRHEQSGDLLLGTIEAMAVVRREQLEQQRQVAELQASAKTHHQLLDNQERRIQLLETSAKSEPPPPDYMTVSEWCRRHRRRLSERNLCRLGSRSKQVCDRNGWPSYRVPAAGRFREVGSYPARAIAAAYTELWPDRQLPLELAP